MKKYLCELFGTFVLVLFGTGVAVLTSANIVATSLAFGLTIVALAYVIGDYSGCHVNPAVTIAMLINKRISFKDAVFYIVAQILGAILGTALLMFIIKSSSLGEIEFTGLGANGFDELSAININLAGAIVTEIVLTFVFVFAVLGVTKDEEKSAVAPIVIGLALVLVHLLGIRITGTSVNPARSLSPALFLRGKELEQVWVFIVGPFSGGILSAIAYNILSKKQKTNGVADKIVNSVETKKTNIKKISTKVEPKKSVKKVTKKAK